MDLKLLWQTFHLGNCILRKHLDVMYDIKNFGIAAMHHVAASVDPGFVSTGDSREILQGTAAAYAG